MSLVKHKGSKFHYYQFMIEGRKFFGSTKTTNKSLALKVEAEKRKEAIEQVMLKQAESITVIEALKQFVESRRSSPKLGRIAGQANKLLGSKSIGHGKTEKVFGLAPQMKFHDVASKDIARLIEARRSEGILDSSIINELAFVSLVINYTDKMGYMVPKLNLPDIRKDMQLKNSRNKLHFLTVKEQNLLLDELRPTHDETDRVTSRTRSKEDNYDFALLLLNFGCRHTELSTMKWSQVDFEKNAVHLYRSKTNNESILQMTEIAKEVFKRRFNKRENEEYVFLNRTGGARKFCYTGIKKAAERAGLADMGFHVLRHTFASNLAQAGLPIQMISKLLGHSKITTTMMYAHLIDDDVSNKAVGILNQINNTKRIESYV